VEFLKVIHSVLLFVFWYSCKITTPAISSLIAPFFNASIDAPRQKLNFHQIVRFWHEPIGKNILPLEMFHFKTFVTVRQNHLIFVASSISRTDVGSYTNLDNKFNRGTLKYQSILKIF
jgi:hypothetical protein